MIREGVSECPRANCRRFSIFPKTEEESPNENPQNRQ